MLRVLSEEEGLGACTNNQRPSARFSGTSSSAVGVGNRAYLTAPETGVANPHLSPRALGSTFRQQEFLRTMTRGHLGWGPLRVRTVKNCARHAAVAQTCQYWDVGGSAHPPAGAVVAHDAAAFAAVVPTQSAPIGGTGEHVLAASHGTCRGLCVGLPMTSGDLPRNKEIVGLRGRPAPAAPWLHASRWAALRRRPLSCLSSCSSRRNQCPVTPVVAR